MVETDKHSSTCSANTGPFMKKTIKIHSNKSNVIVLAVIKDCFGSESLPADSTAGLTQMTHARKMNLNANLDVFIT